MRAPTLLRLLLAALLATTVPLVTASGAVAADGVTASASITASSPDGMTIDLSGAGYAQTPPGIYVGVSEAGGASATDASVYRGTQFIPHSQIGEGGTFAVTLQLSADEVASLDPARDYAVYTLKAHGLAASDPSQNAEIALDVDFSTLQEPTDPEPTDPEPTDPEPTDPEPTDPEPTDPEPTPDPSVTVSSTQFSSEGEATVTVTGRDFDPALATGTRPPFMNKPAGAYVVFGKFAEVWEPSQGAPSSARVNSSQKWAVPADQGSGGAYVELSPDGSFTAELTVDKSAIDAVATSESLVNYGIYTYAGSGAVQATYETNTPITFTDPDPSVTVSSTQFSSEGEATVTVTGRDFDPALATGTRPPFMNKPAGAYVVFGKFAEVWEPSQGAPSSARVNSSQKWAVPADQGSGGAYVELSPDGSFTAELTVDKSAIDAVATSESLVNYGIYTYAGSGAVQATYETYTPITFTDQEPTGPTLEAEITEQAEGLLTVNVTGSGYAAQWPGVYVSIAQSGGPDTEDAGDHLGAQFVPDTAMDAFGGFSRQLSLTTEEIASLDPGADYSVYTFRAHGQPDLDPSQIVEVPLTDLDVELLQGTTDPTDPTDPTGPTHPGPKTRGSLVWGVDAGFRSYVTGPIAKGSISVSGGASSSGGSFRFYQRSTSANDAGVGTTSYGGTVRFTGHGGQLDLRVVNPSVRVESSTRGVLTAVVGGRRIDLATLDLRRASRSTSGGAVTFRSAPATLTSSGASAFQGFYAAGRRLDPVTFTVGSDGGAASGAQTVAAAAVESAFEPPAQPPATSGASIEGVDAGGELEPGQTVTISAPGFQPNETGIAAVVYSDPIVLSQDVTADGSGQASWTGRLPNDLEPGEHTLTLQGSVARGVTFVVAEEETDRCEIGDASVTWGVKESFRSYVSGTIANGGWSTSGDASYETPEFTFAGGDGTFDASASTGEVEFDGAIEFTGHSGALAVTLADPVLRIDDAETATLFLDVTATDRAAAEAGQTDATTTEGVPFVEIDLSSAAEAESSEDGSAMSLTDAPTVLTEQGHAVFSTYEAGTAFDPIDVTIDGATDCAQDVAVAGEDEAVASTSGTSDDSSVTWWIVTGVVAVVMLGAGWGLGRRRPDSV